MSECVWENPVKKKLREGQCVAGAFITVASIETAAHMARQGFDFLWIEMEHSPVTLETLRGMVLATRGLPAIPFARVPANEIWMAKRVLDMGVSGVVFPFTSTPELARQAVAACRYPPLGKRGSGADLAKACWPEPERYYDSADANVLVVAMIEEAQAVERIDEIAATPGLDALFVGASDLSFSLGLRGDQEHPKTLAAIDRVVSAAKRNGKYLGRLAFDPARIAGYREQGFQLFLAPTELGMISSGARRYFELSGLPQGR
jgi:2-keto-3-deoxy-L-rhamnonate aldolase RhmA